MIAEWAFAAQCHVGEPQQLRSQLSPSAPNIQHVWNKRVPKERALPSVIKDFVVQPAAREITKQSWAQLNSFMRSRPKSGELGPRVRRLIPDFQTDSEVSWDEMGRLASGSPSDE